MAEKSFTKFNNIFVVDRVGTIEEGFIQRRQEKAKVVTASWGKELLQFLAVLAILDQDDLKSWLIYTRFCNRPLLYKSFFFGQVKMFIC